MCIVQLICVKNNWRWYQVCIHQWPFVICMIDTFQIKFIARKVLKICDLVSFYVSQATSRERLHCRTFYVQYFVNYQVNQNLPVFIFAPQSWSFEGHVTTISKCTHLTWIITFQQYNFNYSFFVYLIVMKLLRSLLIYE